MGHFSINFDRYDMSLYHQILLLEKELYALRSVLSGNANPIRKYISKRKLHKMELEQEEMIKEYLCSVDTEFRSIYNENASLLVNEQFVCSTTLNETTFFPTNITELVGSIHDNGHLYAQSHKTSIFNHFVKGGYPSLFVGKINPLGEVELNDIRYSWKSSFGFQFPEKYQCSIDKEGNFKMETISTSVLPDRYTIMKKIVGDPFSGDEKKRATFIRNKEELVRRVINFQEELSERTLSE